MVTHDGAKQTCLYLWAACPAASRLSSVTLRERTILNVTLTVTCVITHLLQHAGFLGDGLQDASVRLESICSPEEQVLQCILCLQHLLETLELQSDPEM